RYATASGGHARFGVSSGRSLSWLTLAQHESDRTDGVDQFDRMIRVDFSSKAGDVNVDHVIQRGTPGCLFPDFAPQCITQNDLPLMPHQVLQKLEFPGRQID